MKKNNQKTKFEKFGKKVILNKELLSNTKGGGGGAGWFYTLSGECSEVPHNCWKTLLGVDPWS